MRRALEVLTWAPREFDKWFDKWFDWETYFPVTVILLMLSCPLLFIVPVEHISVALCVWLAAMLTAPLIMAYYVKKEDRDREKECLDFQEQEGGE